MPTNSSFFELPSMSNTTSWTDPGQYSFSGDTATNPVYEPSNYRDDKYDSGLFTDTVSQNTNVGQSSFWGGVWDWANTDVGSSVLGGAISGAGNVWAAGEAADAAKDLSASNNENSILLQQMRNDAAMEMHAAELEQEMAMFMAGEERINRHNTSINAPVNMNTRKFK